MMPSKYNKPIVYPQNEEEHQALELQHSLREQSNEEVKSGFYSEANRDAWLAVLNKAKEILTSKKETQVTTNNSTWTCHKCNNVNSENSDTCLKCQTAKIELTPEQQHMLDCQNGAAKNSGGYYREIDASEIKQDTHLMAYYMCRYTLARKPLEEQIDGQVETIRELHRAADGLNKRIQELEEKVASLPSKHPPYPSVGDCIWTRSAFDFAAPWRKCQVVYVSRSDQAFEVVGFALPRKFNEIGKTWHWEKPKFTST